MRTAAASANGARTVGGEAGVEQRVERAVGLRPRQGDQPLGAEDGALGGADVGPRRAAFAAFAVLPLIVRQRRLGFGVNSKRSGP